MVVELDENLVSQITDQVKPQDDLAELSRQLLKLLVAKVLVLNWKNTSIMESRLCCKTLIISQIASQK